MRRASLLSRDTARGKRLSVVGSQVERGVGFVAGGVMASARLQVLVEGEAPETDSEEEQEEERQLSVPPLYSPAASGLRVPGEAPESDSDSDDEESRAQPPRSHLPPLVVHRSAMMSPALAPGPAPAPAECATLLQHKLLESNARLRCDVTQHLRNVYGSASRDVRATTTHLSLAQNAMISASHSVRLVLEDLHSVADKMDIITSCSLLPDIRAPGAEP